jgi:DNA invertase Pin-like site-specific DNA recombinase
MEVALYVRVSTSRQQQQQTIEQQLSRLHDYVVARPDWHVAEEHILHAALDETFCCACLRLGNK